MNKYLFVFCYRTPRQAPECGPEVPEESSEAVFIQAASPEEALAWGREIAEAFVANLFPDGSPSWGKSDFSHWVESEPEKEYPAAILANLPVVSVGNHPVFASQRP